MRATAGIWPLLALACLVTGCSSSRWSWRSPVIAKQSAAAESDQEKVVTAAKDPAKPKSDADSKGQPDTSTAKPADKPAGDAVAKASVPPDTPFKPSRTPEAKAAASDDTTTDPKPEAVAKVPGSPADLQKDLLVLIDRELQDATPAERDEWFSKLKQVDPAVVPDILRARRMTLQAAQQAAESRLETAYASAALPPASSGAGNPAVPSAAVSSPSAQADLGWGNPWGTPTGSSSSADPFGVVPASHTAADPQRSILRADYVEAGHTPPAIQHAVHRVDPGSPSQAIVLQNYEAGTAAPGTPTPPPYQGQSPITEPRALPSTTAQPAGVPWPPVKAEATTPNGLGAVASHLPFGSNLVQNVVGLVPGRATQSANTPTGAVTPAAAVQPLGNDFRTQLEQTTAFLEQEVAALSPAGAADARAVYVRKHVALRLLYLMGDHQERALTAIPGIPPAEQEFWQQMLWGMVNSLDVEHMPQASDRATQTISQLNGAIRRLQEQADLQIRHVAFCHQILYFGNFEKLPRNEFSPGQEALLYAEIDNFKSDPTAEGQYRTLLRSTIEILSPAGELRKQIEFPATEDLCSTYRRDYFHNYQFRIPERMPLGPHVLKLTVFDELSGKLSSYTVNFLVK